MSLVCNVEDNKGYVKPKAQSISLDISQVKPMIKLLIREGANLEDLLRHTHIPVEHIMRRDIKLNAFQGQQLLLNAIRHAPDLSFAAKLGEQDFINHDSLLSIRVMSCDNVREAMHLLTDYYKLWTNQFDLRFEEQHNGGVFSIWPHIDFGDTLPFYVEYVYSVLYAFGCFCLGERSVPLTFEFSYSKPEKSTHYGRYFSQDVRFCQNQNRVLLPKQLLDRSLIFSDRELARSSDKKALAQISTITASDIVSRTRSLITKSDLAEVNLDAISEQLCMSPRSLRRHLQQHNVSFQHLVNQQRKERALTLLAVPSTPIQEIALQLGYTDASSFSRAFKRWIGQSPKAFRSTQTLRK